jgi:hypothetical protein
VRNSAVGGSISDDGRKVAFLAGASNLVRGDTNRAPDIFVRNLASRTTYRVPIPRRARLLEHPILSGNGRFVFFRALTDVPGGPRHHGYVHDLRTHGTKVVTTKGRRLLSAGGSVVDVSADGRLVALATASPEVAGHLEHARVNSVAQLFVKDLRTGEFRLVTSGVDGKGLERGVEAWDMSRNGRYFALQATSGNVVAGDTNRLPDVFWIDRIRGTTVRLSVRADGRETRRAPGHYLGAISPDGRWVVWTTTDPEFWPGEPARPTTPEHTDDVFIRGPMH